MERIVDAQKKSIAEKCLAAAYGNAMTFPQIVGALIEAGFDGYAVDFRAGDATYYLPDGDNTTIPLPHGGAKVASAFDAAGVAAQIKWAQANPPDYGYIAFCENVMAMGCAGYVVSFVGRRVLYYGRSGETHTEHFPK
jgi:uncharacterized protein YbcV (DUF1398 family)